MPPAAGPPEPCPPSAGMDIASEVAQSGAARTLLSCRRPVHVVPRYIFGKPSDAQLKPWYGACDSPCSAPHASQALVQCTQCMSSHISGRSSLDKATQPTRGTRTSGLS